MKITRSEDKWIFQKNISASGKVIEFLDEVISNNNNITKEGFETILSSMKVAGLYEGRDPIGNPGTLSVRMSQMCFYMYGYKTKDKKFYPSTSTLYMLRTGDYKRSSLVNLFSMQYPNPFSRTNEKFKLYPSRLIFQLLMEKKLEHKLYIDEMIWFLPFIETINKSDFNNLVDNIIEFRSMNFLEKKNLFETVDSYDRIFSNVLHELKYYFLRTYSEFGVFELVEDVKHNEGNLLRFKHGRNSNRNDCIKSNGSFSGYIKLNNDVEGIVNTLLKTYTPFDKPIVKNRDSELLTEEDLLNYMYVSQQIEILDSIIKKSSDRISGITTIINNMEQMSRESNLSGTDFEDSIIPVMEMVKNHISTEGIGGSGRTDIVSLFEYQGDRIQFNIEAKSRGSINNLNCTRVASHIDREESDFCLIIAPSFPPAVLNDIFVHKDNLVAVRSSVFTKYFVFEVMNNRNNDVDFDIIYRIIKENMGTDISDLIEREINSRLSD